ncbi:Transposase [Rickettsia helvetica]|uniref:Transposase n=1 Tax=Rickettsia helvetica TaxID=35789 RepID=A0ABM9NBJ4_RICHE
MDINTIGIDIAKRTFQIHGVDRNGKTVLKKKVSRDQVLSFMVKLPKCLIGIEACGGANYWARELIKLGHEVRLIAPQFVNHMLRLIRMIRQMQKLYVKLLQDLI